MNIKEVLICGFRGAVSNGFLYVIVILILISSLAFVLVGGKVPQTHPTDIGHEVVVFAPDIEKAQNNLQLYTFKGATVTPTAPPPPPPASGNQCISNPFNDEPDIFRASDPGPGGLAQAGGQIRAWVDDGEGGSIAQGTKFDLNGSGLIVTPGDRTSKDGSGANYYLWEPAIYLTPISSPSQPGPFPGDAENGGKPHFPVMVKGKVKEVGAAGKKGFLTGIPDIDPPVNVVGGKSGHGGQIAEYIWDVNSLGLVPGSSPYYRVQMVVHDGDKDLAINCTTIQI